MPKPYYITTTLPYVNAEPHIGFALEIVQADALARYRRLFGDQVVFNTGTDEHGLKIYRQALARGQDPQAYCDGYAAKFNALQEALNLSYTNFIRTTDPYHVAAAQEFWRRCLAQGDIYKKNYQVKYCVGCELEKTESELVDNRCPIHPKLEIELIDEENYFFRWSKYRGALLALYAERPDFVVPANRLEEIRKFVERGLEDFSISRLKAKMPWGVPVPDDADHVMYVWFDALVNYISTLGWPADAETEAGDASVFERFWPGVQVAGKDNLRQQSAMWPAMLMSARLPASKQIFIHGFITSEGQKMSKSLGNVVDPYAVVAKYGTDAVRYYLLGALPSYDDGDWSEARLAEFYTAHLANGVGNLTARVLTMAEKYGQGKIPARAPDALATAGFWSEYDAALAAYKFEEAVAAVNKFVARLDTLISSEKPWEKAKALEDISGLIYQLSEGLRQVGLAILPLMPVAGEKILYQLGIAVRALGNLAVEREWGGLAPGCAVKRGDILFPRL